MKRSCIHFSSFVRFDGVELSLELEGSLNTKAAYA